MTPCEKCPHFKVLNPHFIVDGQEVKQCDIGEHPDYCEGKRE
jgi:hypothetical protein